MLCIHNFVGFLDVAEVLLEVAVFVAVLAGLVSANMYVCSLGLLVFAGYLLASFENAVAVQTFPNFFALFLLVIVETFLCRERAAAVFAMFPFSLVAWYTGVEERTVAVVFPAEFAALHPGAFVFLQVLAGFVALLAPIVSS